jgi:hypothetical protein
VRPAKTMEFIKWLGISFPRWLENGLQTAPEILRKSVDLPLQRRPSGRRSASLRGWRWCQFVGHPGVVISLRATEGTAPGPCRQSRPSS